MLCAHTPHPFQEAEGPGVRTEASQAQAGVSPQAMILELGCRESAGKEGSPLIPDAFLPLWGSCPFLSQHWASAPKPLAPGAKSTPCLYSSSNSVANEAAWCADGWRETASTERKLGAQAWEACAVVRWPILSRLPSQCLLGWVLLVSSIVLLYLPQRKSHEDRKRHKRERTVP